MAEIFGPGRLYLGVLEGTLRRSSNLIHFNLEREVVKATGGQVQAGMGAGTAAMVAAVVNGVLDERSRERANLGIIRDVRGAILDGYDRKVKAGAFRNPLDANRTNRLTGKLRPALADVSNYRTGPREMSILSTSRLTQQARHWARLNFGVQGPAVQGRSPEIRANLFGREYTFGLNEGPRPGYSLPHGSFTSPEGRLQAYSPLRRGMDSFRPHSAQLRNLLKSRGLNERPIRGIEPRYFLEDGLREFPRSFRRRYNSHIRDAINGVHGRDAQVAVRRAIQQAADGQPVDFSNIKITVTD